MTTTEKEQQGSLFDEIVRHSGLQKDVVIGELNEYLHLSGKKLEDLSLNDMRSIVSQYVRKTVLELAEDKESPSKALC